MESDRGLEYWKKKAHQRAERSFGPGAIPDCAVRILDQLHEARANVVEGRDLKHGSGTPAVALNQRDGTVRDPGRLEPTPDSLRTE